jgi:dTMP kinase
VTSGRFIAFEGGEGAGKSTQARLLCEALRNRGLEVVLTREPGGTKGAEAIRELLLDPEGASWEPAAEALLFAAARSDHVAQLVRPALQRGVWVICDRFIDSTRAYQGGGGGLDDEDILELHRFGSGGLMPDLTVLLEATPEEIAKRLARRDGGESDRIGGREAEFHARVEQAFRHFAEAEPARFVRIDGSGPPEATHMAILEALAPLFADES